MKLTDQLAARDPKYNKGEDIKNLGKKKLMDLIKANLKERQKVKK